MMRLRQSCGTGLLLIGAFGAGAFAAASQETTDPAKQKAIPHIAWLSKCSSTGRGMPLDCALEQRAIAKETRQVIAMITIRLPSGAKKLVTMVQVPLGLFLPAGVTVDIDGDMAQNYPLQTCNANGCFVGFPLSDDQLKRMFTGGRLNVTFQYLNKKPVILPMSLEGFTDAYNRIK